MSHGSLRWTRAPVRVDATSQAPRPRMALRSRGLPVSVTAPRGPRPPQPDPILQLTLGKHHLDRMPFALETGDHNVLQRVDAPRRPGDLGGEPPQAELRRREVEQEIEQHLEGGGSDIDARSRRGETVTAAR